MISTLKKLPWHMAGYITIKQQHYIYDASVRIVEQLKDEIDPAMRFRKTERQRRPGAERLTPQLLRRLVQCIMLCPGFTVVQKDNVAQLVNMSEREMRMFNLPRFAQSYNHLYALGPKPGVPLDVLEVCDIFLPEYACLTIMKREADHHFEHSSTYLSSVKKPTVLLPTSLSILDATWLIWPPRLILTLVIIGAR